MNESIISEYQPYAEDFEGRVPWMYLDSLGFLTIGIGHLLYRADVASSNLEAAIKELWKFGGGPQSLRQSAENAQAFVQACGGRKSGPQWDSVNKFVHSIDPAFGEIHASHGKVLGVLGVELPAAGKPGWQAMAAEARKILTLPHGQADAGSFFRCYNSFQLLDEGLDALFENDVQTAIGQLTGQKWVRPDPVRRAKDYLAPAYPEFANFEAFPPSAKMVLVDLAFQMGAAGVAYAGGGAFRKAIGKGDWKGAAKICPQPAEAQNERNAWRRARMEMAVAESLKFDKSDDHNNVMLAP